MRIGGASVTTGRDEHGVYVVVAFDDNATVLSRPRDDPSYAATAAKLGYQSVDDLCLEHDLWHVRLSHAIGLDASPVLWHTAHKTPVHGEVVGAEEDAILAIQRLLNVLRKHGLLQ